MPEPNLSPPSHSDLSPWPAATNNNSPPPPNPKIEALRQQVDQWEQTEAYRKQILELQGQAALLQARAFKFRKRAKLLLAVLLLVIILGFCLCLLVFFAQALTAFD